MTLVDSLPYYDREPTDTERDLVDALVAKELPLYQPLHASITSRDEWLPSSSIMQAELQRVERGEKLSAIDLSRYEDIQPPSTDLPSEWRRALDKSIIAANALSSRIDNLTLLRSFGPNAWTMHVHQTEYSLKQVESELLAVRRDTERINIERKSAQTQAGETLTQLNDRWRALISENLELSVACAVVEQEIDALTANNS